MLNGCFQVHISCDLVWTYLWLPLGLMALFGVHIKNVIGQLQFTRGSLLQAIMGHYFQKLTDTMKWVGCGSWLSKPEGVMSVILEALLEKWFLLSAVMTFMWQEAEQFVLQCGARKFDKAIYVIVIPTKRKPPDPYPRPVGGALHCQVRQYICFKASMALLLPMLLKQQAFAQVPTSFVFQSELSSRVQDASGCGLLDQERYSRRDMQFASHRIPSVPGHQIQREQVRETERAPTPDNQEAEAQVVQDVVVVPRSLQLQASVEVQTSRYPVALESLCSVPTRQTISTRRGVAPQRVTYQVRGQPTSRSTRGMAPQRVTHQVRGLPTIYYLSECLHMIKWLVACDQRKFEEEIYGKTKALVKEIKKKLQLCYYNKSEILSRVWESRMNLR